MARYPVCLGVLYQVWPQICETKLKYATLIHCDICTRWATISKTTNETLPRQIRLDVRFLLICTLLDLELVYFIFPNHCMIYRYVLPMYILFNISIFYLCVYMYSHKSFSAHTFYMLQCWSPYAHNIEVLSLLVFLIDKHRGYLLLDIGQTTALHIFQFYSWHFVYISFQLVQ